MDYQPWMDYIKPDDMPNDDLKIIAESAGIRSALALIFCTPGLTVSIPTKAFSEFNHCLLLNRLMKYRLKIQVFQFLNRHLRNLLCIQFL